MELRAPSEILIRSALYQRMYTLFLERLSQRDTSPARLAGAYESNADPLEPEAGHRFERFEHHLDDARVVVVAIGLLVRALI